MTSSGGGTPVGITIAYKRHQEGLLNEAEKTKKKTKKKKSTSASKTKKPVSSFRVFLEGATVYVGCLVLPTVIGYLLRFYEDEVRRGGRGAEFTSAANDDSWYGYMYNTATYYACPVEEDTDSYFWSYYNYAAAWFCPPPHTEQEEPTSVLSPDTAWTDFGTVAIFSLALAAVRIAIVQAAVPLRDKENVKAVFRCKSIHLLSADYSQTPAGTPVPQRRKVNVFSDQAQHQLQIPSFDPQADYDPNEIDIDDVVLDEDDYDEGKEQEGVVTDIQGLSSGTWDEPPSPSSSNRLYAAPRYATAIFRLLFSSTAALLALYYFSRANFWPWYVFGHGETVNCWDLSGGLVVGMDSDFDHYNVVLKRYFLWQASYHWHSVAFHILSMMILLLHPGSDQDPSQRRYLTIRASTAAYVRSLAQHVLALALIASAYVFSSLRRLGAIGMFAFDVSNSFLHLLQICMNAPDDSRWKKASTVKSIHHYLVLPSFVVTRCMVWPLLWWSSVSESGYWLRQLERTLWPGSASQLRLMFNLWMALLSVSTVIYLKRLLHHAHLARILREKEE